MMMMMKKKKKKKKKNKKKMMLLMMMMMIMVVAVVVLVVVVVLSMCRAPSESHAHGQYWGNHFVESRSSKLEPLEGGLDRSTDVQISSRFSSLSCFISVYPVVVFLKAILGCAGNFHIVSVLSKLKSVDIQPLVFV